MDLGRFLKSANVAFFLGLKRPRSKTGAKVLLFFDMCKFFCMFLNIFCKIKFTKRLFSF